MSKLAIPYILLCLFLGCVYFATSLVKAPYAYIIIAGCYIGVMVFIWRDRVFCPKKSSLKLAAAQRDCPEAYTKFVGALKSPSVRVDGNTGHWSKMYRGRQSLEGLIATFDGSTGGEIKSRIRGAKQLDTNSCSESCEVFGQEEEEINNDSH
mgnify:CR=1 FL=1